jgi:hypothetical protein
MDTEARGKILCPCRGSNPDRPVVQPVVRIRLLKTEVLFAHNHVTPLKLRIFKAMMEAARTSETSVDIQLRTLQYIPEHSELHTRRRKNLKSHM